MCLKCILQYAGQLPSAEIHATKIASLLLILCVQHFPDRHALGQHLRHILNCSVNKKYLVSSEPSNTALTYWLQNCWLSTVRSSRLPLRPYPLMIPLEALSHPWKTIRNCHGMYKISVRKYKWKSCKPHWWNISRQSNSIVRVLAMIYNPYRIKKNAYLKTTKATKFTWQQK